MRPVGCRRGVERDQLDAVARFKEHALVAGHLAERGRGGGPLSVRAVMEGRVPDADPVETALSWFQFERPVARPWWLMEGAATRLWADHRQVKPRPQTCIG